MVKVNLGGCSSFVKDADYKAYVEKALDALEVLENETGRTRIERFSRTGTNVIDFQIPAEFENGEYSVSITTKPGAMYFDSSFGLTIKIV